MSRTLKRGEEADTEMSLLNSVAQLNLKLKE